jgi:hypothetical protein
MEYGIRVFICKIIYETLFVRSKDRMNKNIAYIGIYGVILQSLFKLREKFLFKMDYELRK